jgi:hypothetical protein
MSHTPGPFSIITDRGANGDLVPAVKSDSVGCIVAWSHGRTDAEALANAQLFAHTLELVSCVRAAERALIAMQVNASDPDLTIEQSKAEAVKHPLVVHLRRVISRAGAGHEPGEGER